jgi:hypothetical protein
MGALKGRWQSLRGLRIPINTQEDHYKACRWVSCCILLHNAVLDIDGWAAGAHFSGLHTRAEEVEDRGERDAPVDYEDDEDESKRWQLVQEIALAGDMGLIR